MTRQCRSTSHLRPGFHWCSTQRPASWSTVSRVRFGRIPRRLADLKPVLFEADGSDPNTEVYWTYPLLAGGQAAAALDVRGLTFSCVVLPPLTIGREFVKTQGHYHHRCREAIFHIRRFTHTSLVNRRCSCSAVSRINQIESTTAHCSHCATAIRSRSRRVTPIS